MYRSCLHHRSRFKSHLKQVFLSNNYAHYIFSTHSRYEVLIHYIVGKQHYTFMASYVMGCMNSLMWSDHLETTDSSWYRNKNTCKTLRIYIHSYYYKADSVCYWVWENQPHTCKNWNPFYWLTLYVATLVYYPGLLFHIVFSWPCRTLKRLWHWCEAAPSHLWLLSGNLLWLVDHWQLLWHTTGRIVSES